MANPNGNPDAVGTLDYILTNLHMQDGHSTDLTFISKNILVFKIQNRTIHIKQILPPIEK